MSLKKFLVIGCLFAALIPFGWDCVDKGGEKILPSEEMSKLETENSGEHEKQKWDEDPKPVDGFGEIHKHIVYPEIAKKAGIEGMVHVKVFINQNGEVKHVEIAKSMGNNGLDEAAIYAIKSVQWLPAQLNGNPVDAKVVVPIRFKLRNDENLQRENTRQSDAKIEKPNLPPLPPVKGESSVHFVWDENPEPVDGYEAIWKSLKYPQVAQKAGIEGVVIIQVTIDENGNVNDWVIKESLGDNGTSEAAIEAIRSVKWKPAKKDGQPVKVRLSIPVRFRLN